MRGTMASHLTHGGTANEHISHQKYVKALPQYLQLYSLNLKMNGRWTTSKDFFFCFVFSLFRILSLVLPLLQKDVQWSFPVFHIKKQTTNTHLQTTYTSLVRTSFLTTTTSVMGDIFVTQEEKALRVTCCCDRWGGWKCMTSCRPTFRTCIGLRAGFTARRVRPHMLFLSRYTGVKPSDWSLCCTC